MNKQQLINHLKQHNFPKPILEAINKVNRKKYIPEEFKKVAYLDNAQPIGHGQTISQPYTIAFMLFHLELKDNQKILEVGSGSGYVLDLISNISKNSRIFGIERIKSLAEKSKQILKNKNKIKIINKNGSKGLKEEAPFDRILVSASANQIPENLINQLKVGGILVIPIKDSIIVLKKNNKEHTIKEHYGFIFVPLIESD
jgi:protein-L-isoaspartate(D-aspartate) O-methyltransferase